MEAWKQQEVSKCHLRSHCFLKYWPNAASLCLFSSFSRCNDKYSKEFDYKSLDGELGNRTWDHWMVGADESTELCGTD